MTKVNKSYGTLTTTPIPLREVKKAEETKAKAAEVFNTKLAEMPNLNRQAGTSLGTRDIQSMLASADAAIAQARQQ